MDEDPISLDLSDSPPHGRQDYPKIARPYTNIATELLPDELTNPGVQKLILSEISRLEFELDSLRKYESEFHRRDKECTALTAQAKKDKTLDYLYSGALTIAGILLGWSPSNTGAINGFPALLLGFGLLVLAAAARIAGTKK